MNQEGLERDPRLRFVHPQPKENEDTSMSEEESQSVTKRVLLFPRGNRTIPERKKNHCKTEEGHSLKKAQSQQESPREKTKSRGRERERANRRMHCEKR